MICGIWLCPDRKTKQMQEDWTKIDKEDYSCGLHMPSDWFVVAKSNLSFDALLCCQVEKELYNECLWCDLDFVKLAVG